MLTRLHAKDYLRTPWKNGLGFTDQIAISPPNADLRRANFLWRISTAQISQSANFSIFPDHDRILVVVSGAGVRLSHTFVEGDEPEMVELSRLEPYEFPGDIPTHSELRNGPIQDFSVFLRKGEVSAQAEILNLAPGEAQSWRAETQTSFLFVAEGSLKANEMALNAGDALRIDLEGASAPEELILESTASATNLICVRIESI